MQLRPPRPDDAEAVLAVLEARDIADIGVSEVTLADLDHDWRSIEFDSARDARVAVLDRRVRGYAHVRRPGSLGVVAPDSEGRGIGTRLLAWAEGRERERATRPHRQRIADVNAPGRALLAGSGYCLARSTYRMTIPLARFEAAAPPPQDVTIRALQIEADALRLHALDVASFAGADDYEPMSADVFRERHLEAHDTAPELTCVAERAGRIVGFALVSRRQAERLGHIDVLAVAPDQQAQGIGTALLTSAFARIKAAGLARAELGVSSTNPGAVRLYERMGMTRRYTFDTYERPLER
jgi:mycothiol synthase